MIYIVISLSFLLLGTILIIKNKDNFIYGSIFTLGLILTILTVINQVFSYLIDKHPKMDEFVFLLVYITIFICLILIILFILISTFLMLRKEGRSPTVFMGICLLINFIFIIACPLILDLLYSYNIPNRVRNIFIDIFMIIWFVDFILTTLFVLYLIYSVIHQIKRKKGTVDYIITLGAGITSDQVTPLLKSRLDKGVQYFQENPEAIFIVSGGQGPDEPVSEAYAMSKYLRQIGIPESRILLEDLSTTTYENMMFSKKKILEQVNNDKNLKDINVIFTTNNYHVFRASLYAKKAKLKASGVGAPTAHYFLPNALIREFIALLVMHKYQISILILIAIAFIILTS